MTAIDCAVFALKQSLQNLLKYKNTNKKNTLYVLKWTLSVISQFKSMDRT